MKYVIGVDQGGSGTRAVICTLDGRMLGAGFGPGACHPDDGMDFAMEATMIAINQALQTAECPMKQALGFPGGLSLIHISEPKRLKTRSRMPSSS